MERKPSPLPRLTGNPYTKGRRSEAPSSEQNQPSPLGVSSQAHFDARHEPLQVRREAMKPDVTLVELLQSRELSDPEKSRMHKDWIGNRLKEADRVVGKTAILALSGMIAWETGAFFFHHSSPDQLGEVMGSLGSFLVSGAFFIAAAQEMKRGFDKCSERAKNLFKKDTI